MALASFRQVYWQCQIWHGLVLNTMPNTEEETLTLLFLLDFYKRGQATSQLSSQHASPHLTSSNLSGCHNSVCTNYYDHHDTYISLSECHAHDHNCIIKQGASTRQFIFIPLPLVMLNQRQCAFPGIIIIQIYHGDLRV